METTTEQIGALLTTIEEKRANAGRVGLLLSSGYLADGLDRNADLSDREGIRAAIGLPPLTAIETSIDFSQTSRQMLGSLPFEIPIGIDFMRLYPSAGKGVGKFQNFLIPYQPGTSRSTQVRFMKKHGCSPARHEHGIAFWKALGPKQRWIRIACLGYLAKQDGPDREREVFCIEGRRCEDSRIVYYLNSRRVHEELKGIGYLLGIREI